MENKILVGIVVVLLVTAAFLYTMPTAEIETSRTPQTQRVSASTANSGVSTSAEIEGIVPVGGSTMTTAEVL